MILDQRAPGKIDLSAIVKEQAKLRVALGLPIILGGAMLLWRGGVSDGTIGFIAALHILYVAITAFVATRPRPFSAAQLALVTAILDPLMLTVWLPFMGEFGGLVVGFYLFTILGFGFRIGLRLMQICQVVSIAGFTIVLALEPFWRLHYIVWLSFSVMLILVPLYSKILIKKLHEARAHAERESQAKSELLAKVSHELRTPLSGIVAAAQLLAAESKDKQTTKRADTILGLSRDLLREINDLLDQAKHEAKALLLESAPFDLHDQMERVRLTLESIAAKKGIAFHVNVDDSIRDQVQGDSHYLSRALINLGGNAVKFTDRGKVEINAKLLGDHSDRYELRFSVQDTGIGIPKELQHRIFEPFFQVASGTTRQYGGTGLGMTIAKEIVNLMNGDIELESELAKGSLFYFDLTLPKAKVLQEAACKSISPVVFGKRVLVADDNDTNLTLIMELLERDRHVVVGARSGGEALEALAYGEFDVIFLDFNMADMDGAKVLQVYRFGKLNSAPAFFLTADATATTAAKLRNSGAVGILNKPITTDGLRRAIAQVCDPDSVRVPAVPTMPAQSKPTQSALTAVPTQHINYAVIEELKTISDRPQFLGELLGNAVEDINRNCHNLVQALSIKDYEHVRDTAHALKGVCASVGAARLEWLAGTLMRAPRHELEQGAERLKTDVAEAGRMTVAAIRDVMLDRAAVN